jgi:hypothetical protein
MHGSTRRPPGLPGHHDDSRFRWLTIAQMRYRMVGLSAWIRALSVALDVSAHRY